MENREGESHYFPRPERTLTGAKVRGAVQFCEKMGYSILRRIFFEHLTFLAGKDGSFCVMILRQGGATMMHLRRKPRAANLFISSEIIHEDGTDSRDWGIEARSYTWEQLGYEVGLECSGRIIRKAMGTMDYHKCIACRRGWVNEKKPERIDLNMLQ